MKIKAARKTLEIIIVLFLVGGVTGCSLFKSSPEATGSDMVIRTDFPVPSPTNTPSITLSPTKANTITPKPTSTSTQIPPVATSSITNNQAAITIGAECRTVIDGLYTLKKDFVLPDHFLSENPFRQNTDFNPNQYFKGLTHLKITPGYVLDYVYFTDELGGLPLVYARKSNDAPIKSYDELLESFGEEVSGERSYGELLHKYDYLWQIQIDKTPESYFEFVTLAFLGDQFYLWWHALYNDAKVLCDSSDISYVEEDMALFSLEFPQDIKDRIEQIDFSPIVLMNETTVTVRFVTFTKWGGFFENVYVMDKENPLQLQDVQFNPLIPYDCGINF